jgi:cellulose synthase/poly-beta-1,6-N-acetylglucosamine synthase-like glycosyltransferase
MTGVFAACAIICLVLFVHPYVGLPLSLRLMRSRPLALDPSAPLPSATLVFSAYNEERALPSKLANLEAIRALHPGLEILAYSDMSADRTLEILLSRPDLLRVVRSTERTGKATGMRRMVAEARGDVIIFTDANVLLDPASVAPMLRYFSDRHIGGVSGTLRYINEADGATAKVGGLYWRLEEALKSLESRCGSMMGADGSIFATRRAIYPVVPAHLLDDMTVSMSVLFEGLRLISGPDVIAYEKSTTSSADEFRRKRRIAARAFNTHRFLWPKIRRSLPLIDQYKYVSHKLLRWFGLPFLILFALLATLALVEGGWGRAASFAWVGALLAYWLGRTGRVPVLGAAVEILHAVIATFVGVLDSLRGMTYQTWSPAKSRD